METEKPAPKEPLTAEESSFLNEAGKTSFNDMVAARELAEEKSGVTTAPGQIMITEKNEAGVVTQKPVTELAQRENVMPSMPDPGYLQARDDRWQTPEPAPMPALEQPAQTLKANAEPSPTSVPQPVAESALEVMPEPVAQPVAEIAPQPTVQPVAEAMPQPTIEPMPQPAPEAPAPRPEATPQA